MKVVISDPKGGRSFQTEIPADKAGTVVGLKIGGSFDGGIAGAAGYKLQVTGGSDKDGIPMRPDVGGGRRTYAILSSGPGIRAKEKGERRRKAVRGNLVTAETAQLNTKILEYGEKKLEELFPSKPKEEKKK